MKKLLAFLLVMVMLASLFAGCTGGKAPADEKKTETTQPAANEKKEANAEKKAEPVTIKFFNWYNGDGSQYLKKLSEAVKAKYPNITLEYEMVNWDTMHPTLQTRIASNDLPDLLDFKGQDIPKYAKAGHLLDLTGQEFLKDIPPSALANLKVDGKDYSIPYTCVYQGVMYNTKIFADNGIEIPKTYDELMKIVEKLKAKGITPFATHFKDNWNIGNITMQFAMSEVFNKNPNWGKDLYADKVKFATSPEYKLVFEHAKDQYSNTFKDTYSIDMAKACEMFAKGQAAMYATGTWTLSDFEKAGAAPEAIGIFPFPGKDPGAKLIFEPDHTWAASASSKNKAAILQVLGIVATDKELAKVSIEALKTHSMLKDVLPAAKSKVLDDINEYKKNDKIVDVSIGNVQIKWPYQEEYSRYITEWLMGKKSLDDALKAADAYKSKVKAD